MSNDVVAQAIDGEARSMIVRRQGEGMYDEGGDWVPGADIDSVVMAAVFPAAGRVLEDLPEGIRAETRMLFWSRSSVKENEVVITPDGKHYRVLIVWDRTWEGGFYKAALGGLA